MGSAVIDNKNDKNDKNKKEIKTHNMQSISSEDYKTNTNNF